MKTAVWKLMKKHVEQNLFLWTQANKVINKQFLQANLSRFLSSQRIETIKKLR